MEPLLEQFDRFPKRAQPGHKFGLCRRICGTISGLDSGNSQPCLGGISLASPTKAGAALGLHRPSVADSLRSDRASDGRPAPAKTVRAGTANTAEWPGCSQGIASQRWPKPIHSGRPIRRSGMPSVMAERGCTCEGNPAGVTASSK